MLVRGSLTVKKRLQLLNPGGTIPGEGLMAVTDAQGNLRWENLKIPALKLSSTYATPGTLVLHIGKIYFSLINNAEGEHISNPSTWKNISSSTSSTTGFTQDLLDALDTANEPSAGNPFVTKNELHNLYIKGTDTAANILLKSALTPNMLWISSTLGYDSEENTVLSGDGMVSNGTRWLGIGPVRGPRAFEDAPSDGKQYARQDASWAVVGPPPAVTFQNVLDNGRTAVINSSSINLFDRVNGRTTVSATLQDPGNAVFAGISIDPFIASLWGNDAVQRAGLTISGGKIAFSQYNYITSKESYVSFTPPISNTNLQFPSKSISGTYILATTNDIPTSVSQLMNDTGFIVLSDVPKNQQKTVSANFVLSNTDNGYVIVINNGTTPITITVPAGLMAKIEVGFLQLGTGDVSFVASGTAIKFPAPQGLKIKGENYNCMLVQIGSAAGSATNNYNLLGDTKA